MDTCSLTKKISLRSLYLSKWFLVFSFTVLISVSGCKNKSGLTQSEDSPVVMATNPDNNAVDIPVNSTVTAVFNDQMNPSTITDTTFTLRNDTVAVAGTINYSDSLATFTPSSNLSFGGTYTATITTGVENLSGITIENNYEWSFTTEEETSDTTQPQIVSTVPANEAENVSVNSEIKATFSEPMDPSSINSTTFTVAQGETSIPGTIELEDAIATFIPDNPLDFNTGYTATVTSGAEDTTGNPLPDNATWSFTTETEPDTEAPEISSTEPADNAENVPITTNISATFSEQMNQASVQEAFTVSQGGSNVAGSINFSGNTATFNPDDNLDFATTVTATISKGARDLAGNALASSFTWGFTTSEEPDNTAPEVTAVNPTNGQQDVPVNTNITVTFSETVNTETVNQATFIVKQGDNSIQGEVTVSDNTATFNPASNLPFENNITVTITSGVQDLAGNALAGNFSWTFTTNEEPDNTAPEVTDVNPDNEQQDVPVSTNITATFSEPVNPETVNQSTLTVTQGNTSIQGEVSVSKNTATFNPTSNLPFDNTFEVTITTGVQDLAGNTLGENFSWSFTTEQESEPPVVDSNNPDDGATNVPVNTNITATFSESMNEASVDAAFTVSQNGSNVAGDVTFDGNTATFNPDNNLNFVTSITATISTNAQDLAGNNLESNFSWSFTTEQESIPPEVDSNTPEDGASNVPVNTNITATFSEEMDQESVQEAFTVSQNGSAVSGAITFSGNTATFNPNNNLDFGTSITATISTDARDLVGNKLESEFSWSFTTEQESVPPEVSSTNPADGASDVPVDSDIKATFNEEMNPATINKNTFFVTRNGTQIEGDISYSGVTATFNPSSNLGTGRTYSVTITTGAKDLAGNALENNVNWTFTTEQETTPPVVNTTSPTDGATDVPVNTNISASFSESMDQASVQGAFTVSQNGSDVAGTVSFSENTAIFNPANNLSFNNSITATISTGAQDLAGNNLESNYSWEFTTEQESTPPTVSFVSPTDGEDNVPVNTNISVGFSEAMDQASVQDALTVSQNGSAVAGALTFSGNNATFNPNNNLNFGTSITATISTDAQDLAGNNLQNDFVWSFTTEQESVPPKVNNTNPSDGTIDVPVSSNITATFSEEMDPATINETTFVITQGGVGVEGDVNYSNNKATFNPTNDLVFDSEYTATITTGAQDLVGNAMESNFTWRFTTEQETIPPEVESVEPEAGATGVPVNTVITADFSEEMDQSTINTTNFNVSQGGILVSGSVSYSGTTATFTPTSNLLFGIQYDIIITSDVQDLVGNSMTNDFRWSFTTEDIDEDIDR